MKGNGNLEIQRMLEFEFMYSLESRDSGGNGKCNRGTVRKSYHESKHVDKWKMIQGEWNKIMINIRKSIVLKQCHF